MLAVPAEACELLRNRLTGRLRLDGALETVEPSYRIIVHGA